MYEWESKKVPGDVSTIWSCEVFASTPTADVPIAAPPIVGDCVTSGGAEPNPLPEMMMAGPEVSLSVELFWMMIGDTESMTGEPVIAPATVLNGNARANTPSVNAMTSRHATLQLDRNPRRVIAPARFVCSRIAVDPIPQKE
jgi:hypothetical protein